MDFQVNFTEDKAENTEILDVFQGFPTQSSAKFAEKLRAISCEDRFLYYFNIYYGDSQEKSPLKFYCAAL